MLHCIKTRVTHTYSADEIETNLHCSSCTFLIVYKTKTNVQLAKANYCLELRSNIVIALNREISYFETVELTIHLILYELEVHDIIFFNMYIIIIGCFNIAIGRNCL